MILKLTEFKKKECPADAGFRLPYAVRDMSEACEDYEVAK